MNHPVDTSDLNLEGVVQPKDAHREPVLSEVPSTRPQSEFAKMQRRRSWRVNYGLLAGTVVFIAVAGTALYFWREYQVQRNAHVLIGRAESFEADEDWRSAADFYHRYLQLVPSDTEVIVARARAFDKSATSPDRVNQAITMLLQATDAAADEISLRQRLAERLVELGRWDRARQQALLILETQSDNLDASRIAALAAGNELNGSGPLSVTEAVQAHLDGLDKHPGDPVLSSSLATLYRAHAGSFTDSSPEQMEQKADEVIDRMVTERPQEVEVYLARYRYCERYGLDRAEDDLERALELAPESSEVLRLATAKFASSDPQRARELAEHLVVIAPEDSLSYQSLADLQARTEQVDEAIATLQQGLDATGDDNYSLQRALLALALDSRRLELADKTRKQLNDWFRRVSKFLTTTDRRRLDEDLQLAEARHLLLSGQPEAAVPILRRLTVTLAEGLDADRNLLEREQRLRLLAQAYSALQQWDLAVEAMAEAARLRPTGYQSLLVQAGYARQGGDLDRAIQLAQEAAAKPTAPAEVWLVLAEMLIEAEFQKGTDPNRNWRQVRAVLAQARESLEGTPAYASLKARWALADGRPEDALAELGELLPVEAIPLDQAGNLALLFAAAGDESTAEAIAQHMLESPQHARLGAATQVALMARRRDFDGARQRIEEILQSDEAAEQAELLPRLIAMELQGGFVDEARQHLAQLRDSGPLTIPLLEMGASLAMQGEDWNELERYVTSLERQEGPHGTVWRLFRALASLERHDDQGQVDLMHARELARKMEELRPQWPLIGMVRGRMAERQNRLDEALNYYREALRQGARNAVLIDWFVGALYRENRFSEAVEVLRELGSMSGLSTQLSGLTLPAYLREGRVEDAVQLARTTAKLHPKDPVSLMLYAQALTMNRQFDEAEGVFRQAIQLAPHDPRPWSGLIWFHARADRPLDGRRVVEEVKETKSLPKTERDLLVARGLAFLGDRIGAAASYQAAIDARPDDQRLLEEAARYFTQSNPDRALALYRRILAVDPNSRAARRAIALITGLQGTEEGLAEALALVRVDSEPVTDDDKRLEAMLLMLGDPARREEGIGKLRELMTQQSEVPIMDHIILAQALEQAGRPDEARAEFERVLGPDTGSEFIAIFVAFLMRQQQWESAEPWLRRLEEATPAGPLALQLRAEWLAGLERNDEIPPLVQQFIEQGTEEPADQPQAAVIRSAAETLLHFQFTDETERLLSQFRSDPAVAELLVDFLMKQERLGEAAEAALEDAGRFGEQQPPVSLTQVMTRLAARNLPTSAIDVPVEAEFERALARHPEHLRFLFDLGTLRVMQQRYDESIQLYEKTLRLHPDHAVSMNNLAIILAETPGRESEALAMIERLVGLVPDSLEVQDSHALVLLAMENHHEALGILRPLTEARPEDPRFLFHTAIALDGLGKADDAREALKSALSHGLEKQVLTPRELTHLDQLRHLVTAPE